MQIDKPDRPLWLCVGASHPYPQRHWHHLCSCAEKLLLLAGIDECCTSARGCTATLGNFAKAAFDAVSKT
ncbi:40S ribosomal protein S2 [Cricetulus griseus]|uniref:40S ribosomal protein S2 n=1 Tax=Cricetulus griseus TaxID=10029 RepID=G3GSG3_CRIGR|nr:40S ribosomal protein S2 [Cricetulus griseus]